MEDNRWPERLVSVHREEDDNVYDPKYCGKRKWRGL